MGHSRATSTLLSLGFLSLLGVLPACSGSVKTDGCEYLGQHHAPGESFKAEDQCNSCQCAADGEVACTITAECQAVHCSAGGVEYAVGDRTPSGTCESCLCTSTGSIACSPNPCPNGPTTSCSSLQTTVQQELSTVQACTIAAECGQVIPGSSCGCTRDLVANNHADLSKYQSLLKQAASAGCDTGGGSTCDCPEADGFACINHACAWNYTTKVEPEPTCQPYDAGELCVRGTPTADGEVLTAGDALKVTVRSAGCLSSSCSQVQEASCTVSGGNDFEVKAKFCVADTSKPGQGCTADCGNVHADCSFGQPLAAGEHQVKVGAIAVGFQVPSKLPFGGLCASAR